MSVFVAPLLGAAKADSAESLLAKSGVAAKAGNLSQAERWAEAAIVAQPERASTYVALADLYRRQGHGDFANFYYAEALEIDPENREAEEALAANESMQQAQSTAAERSLDNQKGEH